MNNKMGIDASNLRKDIKKLGASARATADGAVRVALKQAGAFYMQFDETESVPYAKDSNGQITISSGKLVAQADVEEILAVQTRVAAGTLQQLVQKGIKEALG